jgi:manganese/zinc/iron transport system permease protein
LNLSPLAYFIDPVLRAPTIGSMLMCLSAALVGVVIFLRKQSLLGEALSHAAYPGVLIGVVFAALLGWNDTYNSGIPILIMAGAFITALLGLWMINLLVRKVGVRADSALCFVLSSFFGIGLTIASRVQFTHSGLYKQSINYLYGQAATMTDIHILIYGILSLLILLTLVIFYKEIQAITFDRDFARSMDIPVKRIDFLVFMLVVFAVVIGIRSVGVVLMSAMLIAPAAAARQYTQKLSIMLILAGLFGLTSGYLGNYLSVQGGTLLSLEYPESRIALPTGPMIVVVATVIAVLSLFLAPERGLITRVIRIVHFRYQCLCENILKQIWRHGPKESLAIFELANYQNVSQLYIRFVCKQLVASGWLYPMENQSYKLTPDGEFRAAHIVRLHRLWEVYLADYLGIGVERVHRSAEEMEHIITPELEKELTLLLKNPKKDPHHQPIPPKFEEPN